MIKNFLLILPEIRVFRTAFFLIILFILSLNAQAQPEFSASELRLIKERGGYSKSLKYHLPQDKFPMPEMTESGKLNFADGNIDATFNSSVTEGFGYVNETVVQPDGKIIAVGLFQRANGARTNGIARFNADGSLDTSFNAGSGASAAIRAVALQSDGKIIIGGAFTVFNNQAVNRIVRLNSDGSIDSSFSLTVAFNNQINDVLVLADGKIMVGGAFTLSSTRLVRLNSNGTLDSAISSFNNNVFTIALAPDGKIVIGGQFSLPKPTIARLNNDGTLDSVFSPTTGGAGSPVYKAIVQPNGKIIAAGAFRVFNGTETDAVVRLNDNGSIDSTFEITNLDPLSSAFESDGLALQPDGKILVSFFDNSPGSIADVRRFNSDASPDATFNTNTDNSLAVIDLNLLANGKVLAGGYFVTVNNQQRLRLVKLNSDGSFDNTFNPAVSAFGIVYAIERQPDGKVLIGGDFEYVNGVAKRAVARLNADGSLDNSFNISGFVGDIYAIKTQPDGKIIIGGLFSSNFPASGVARLNPNGSFEADMGFLTNTFVNVAYALDLQSDGKILIGGLIFNNVSARLTAIRVNTDATLETSFTPATLPNGTVRAILAQPNGKIIIGGNFISNGIFQRTGLARLNSNGTLDSAIFGGNANVASVKKQSDGAIVAGGSLLTRHSSEGVIDTTLNTGTGFDSQIRAVEIQPDGKILLGGFFTLYNGNSVNRVIRISNIGAVDSAFEASAAGTVLALNLQPDGKILAGGQFLDFNGTEKLSLVRLQNSAALRRAPFDFDGDNKTDISIFRPAPGEWWYLRSSDGGNRAFQFGAGTDKVVPADYTGDGKTDVAFWRPVSGQWFILRSEDSSFFAFPFGASGDVPVPADYDGDGKADAAVFRESSLTWFISKSSGGTDIIGFGISGDKPVVSDYDGDGKADIAIFRPNGTNGAEWWIRRSANNSVFATQFGAATDKPVQGDYTGDGKTDIAFWQPSSGNWFILRSEDFSFYSFPFGTTNDVPVAGDYDGDSKFDAGVFRPSSLTWFVQRSTAGTLIQNFGIAGDLPLPSAFVP